MNDIQDKTVTAKRKKSDALEAGNERSYQELQEATGGKFGMDTSDMRRELLIEKLVEWGIITSYELVDFDIEFHLKVEEALNGAWTQYREAVKQQAAKPKLVLPPTTPKKLLDVHGRPIG